MKTDMIIEALKRWSPKGLCSGEMVAANGKVSQTEACAVGCLLFEAFHAHDKGREAAAELVATRVADAVIHGGIDRLHRKDLALLTDKETERLDEGELSWDENKAAEVLSRRATRTKRGIREILVHEMKEDGSLEDWQATIIKDVYGMSERRCVAMIEFNDGTGAVVQPDAVRQALEAKLPQKLLRTIATLRLRHDSPVTWRKVLGGKLSELDGQIAELR